MKAKILGLFDNIIQSYEVELKNKIPRLMNSVLKDLEKKGERKMTLNEALCCVPQHITLKHIEDQKIYTVEDLLNTSDEKGYDIAMVATDMWVILKDKKPVMYSIKASTQNLIKKQTNGGMENDNYKRIEIR